MCIVICVHSHLLSYKNIKTYQFSNYYRYDAASFSEAHKAEVRDTQFPIDLEKAYELGKRLVGKCK